MDSPDAPVQPDPQVVAQAQGAENLRAAHLTTALGRPNQITPYGSLTWERGADTRSFNQARYDEAVRAAREAHDRSAGIWSNAVSMGGNHTPGDANTAYMGQTGDRIQLPEFVAPDRNSEQFWDTTPSDQWTSRVTLDPRVQSLLDAQLATSQGLQGSIQSALGRVNSTFSQAAPTPNDEMRRRVEDALYGRLTSRLNPRFQEEDNNLRTTLMNRGLTEGSQAWDAAMANLGRTKNDAYSGAMRDAVIGGGSEMARQYEMEMAGRNAVLNELNALRSGSQVTQPTFSNHSGGTVAPVPTAQIAQNAHQNSMNQYSADVAAGNSQNAALAGLATAAIGVFF